MSASYSALLFILIGIGLTPFMLAVSENQPLQYALAGTQMTLLALAGWGVYNAARGKDEQ